MRKEEWWERERDRWRPLIGSWGEREKGMGDWEGGWVMEWMVRARVSREKGPVWGWERVRRAVPWMVEEGKSR